MTLVIGCSTSENPTPANSRYRQFVVTDDWLDPDTQATIITEADSGAALITKTLEETPRVSFIDDASIVIRASAASGDVQLEELGRLNSNEVLRDLFVADNFIVAHFENQEVVLYYTNSNGANLEEVADTRFNLDMPDNYAFDVSYSQTGF